MKIPLSTKKPRFYVASSMHEAYSSWDTLEEALESMSKILAMNAMPVNPEKDLLGRVWNPQVLTVIGIVQTGPVVIVDTRNLIEKV